MGFPYQRTKMIRNVKQMKQITEKKEEKGKKRKRKFQTSWLAETFWTSEICVQTRKCHGHLSVLTSG